MIDFFKEEYDTKIFVGVDDVDIKAIHIALNNGEKLVIDRNGHIYNETGRWIADGMERSGQRITKYSF